MCAQIMCLPMLAHVEALSLLTLCLRHALSLNLAMGVLMVRWALSLNLNLAMGALPAASLLPRSQFVPGEHHASQPRLT